MANGLLGMPILFSSNFILFSPDPSEQADQRMWAECLLSRYEHLGLDRVFGGNSSQSERK